MTMQNNIDTIRRNFRWNMHQPELQTSALEINHQRPVFVPIAVTTDNTQGRSNRFEIERDRRFANVAEMPNLVGLAGKVDNFRRQLVMRVRQNKYTQRLHIKTTDGADNADIPSAIGKIIRLNPRNPQLALHHVI